MEHSTFHTNLSRLRQIRDLTVEELAGMVGLSKQAVSNYENGARSPDSTTLLALSNALDVPPDYFYDDYPVQLSLRGIRYREGMTISERQRRQVEELTRTKLNDYLELENIAKEYINFKNPLRDMEVRSPSDAEKAARQLRKSWKLGEGLVYNISSLLEKKGVRILKVNFKFNYDHEGLSGWAEEGKIPVIVLNVRHQDVTRIRFTILHELGHLLLMIPSGLEHNLVERICDTFAGAVLMPVDILLQEFGKNRTAISMLELIRIKEMYGISITAIMVRARVTNLITFEAYQEWRSNEDSHRDRGQYMGTEEPQKFMQMLFRCLSERKIGIDKAASLVGQDEADFRRVIESEIKL